MHIYAQMQYIVLQLVDNSLRNYRRVASILLVVWSIEIVAIFSLRGDHLLLGQ